MRSMPLVKIASWSLLSRLTPSWCTPRFLVAKQNELVYLVDLRGEVGSGGGLNF